MKKPSVENRLLTDQRITNGFQRNKERSKKNNNPCFEISFISKDTSRCIMERAESAIKTQSNLSAVLFKEIDFGANGLLHTEVINDRFLISVSAKIKEYIPDDRYLRCRTRPSVSLNETSDLFLATGGIYKRHYGEYGGAKPKKTDYFKCNTNT